MKPTGRYRHSKTGKHYYVVEVGMHEKTREEFVVYKRTVMPSLPYQGIARRALVVDPAAPKYDRDIDVSAVMVDAGPTSKDEMRTWIRPLCEWDELVEVEGKIVPRFVKTKSQAELQAIVDGITDEVDY